MLNPHYKNKFKKDLERVKRRGKNLKKLTEVMEHLISQRPLDQKYLNHFLKGEYADCRECHIEPDWLLIYLIDGNSIIFIRTGTHADLFK